MERTSPQEPFSINKNKETWSRFEKAVDSRKSIDAEELAELYIQASDDLSFARTYFPNSKVPPYLNRLTSVFHQEIYKNKKEDSVRSAFDRAKREKTNDSEIKKKIIRNYLVA